MENKDRLKNMVFKYLDGLFENINIEEIKFYKFTFSLIDTSEIKTFEGRVGDSRIFLYFPESNTISFNRDEYRAMVGIFGFDSIEGLNYIKSYFVKNVDGVPDDVVISA